MSALEWKRYREDAAPAQARVIERCQPVSPVVVDVVLEPEAERGTWDVHYRHCGSPRKGRADTVEAAKEAALTAAEAMLAQALCELVALRTGVALRPLAPGEAAE